MVLGGGAVSYERGSPVRATLLSSVGAESMCAPHSTDALLTLTMRTVSRMKCQGSAPPLAAAQKRSSHSNPENPTFLSESGNKKLIDKCFNIAGKTEL